MFQKMEKERKDNKLLNRNLLKIMQTVVNRKATRFLPFNRHRNRKKKQSEPYLMVVELFNMQTGYLPLLMKTPEKNRTVPNPRPCARPIQETANEDDDYHSLVNSVQRHTRSSVAYCFVSILDNNHSAYSITQRTAQSKQTFNLSSFGRKTESDRRH